MLSIGALKLGQEDYYLKLGQDDYYFQGGEPQGQWLASGAAQLGLSGTVTPRQLKSLFQGFDSNRNPFVQNAGSPKRQPAWDLTFSAPKSVSVYWSQADQATRREIQQAQAAAVKKAIEYLEQEAAYSRIGKGGAERVPAALVVATFEHGTSRALEPQLHTHALVLNLAIRPDNTSGSILSKPLYQHKMVAGALYRTEFAYQLRKRLGLAVEQKKTWFEILGVPKSLTDYFSTRRKEIEQVLSDKGLESACAAAFANLSTRDLKDLLPPRQELHATWQQEGLKHHFGPQVVEFLKHRSPLPKNKTKQLNQAVSDALDIITSSESHFTEQQLLCTTAQLAPARGVDAASLVVSVKHHLKNSPDIINLGTRNEQHRYTTRELFDVEAQLIQDAQTLNERRIRTLSDKTVAHVITRQRTFTNDQGKKQTATLSYEQGHAVAHLTQSPGAIKAVSGLAGTGKTTMLGATREAFEKEGYRVIGACVTAKAARGLQEGSGIDSDTLHMRLMQLYPDPKYLAKHHAKQVFKLALRTLLPTLRLKALKLEKLKIDYKTVFVLDEAGMVGTRDMALLFHAIRERGGRLILVGDEKQLPSIEAGGAFGSIVTSAHCPHLEEITRQEDPWAREAVKQLSRGAAEEFLKTYAEKGLLTVEPTPDDVAKALVDDWKRAGGLGKPEQHAIAVSTNDQVDQYNDLAQAERARAGHLDLSTALTVGNETFHPGDRIAFLKNSRKLGIANGQVGTIHAIKDQGWTKAISVVLDGQKKPIVIPIRSYLGNKYDGIRRGYAFTTHKLQGATLENAYVVLGGSMTDREMTYVQGSRARKTTSLYVLEADAGHPLSQRARGEFVPKVDLAGKPVEQELDSPLARQMTQSRQQELAHEFLPDSQLEPEIESDPKIEQPPLESQEDPKPTSATKPRRPEHSREQNPELDMDMEL